MVISEDAGRAPLAPSPPPTPVPPSDTPLDYIMEAPRLSSTPRLPLDPSLGAMIILQNMHTSQSSWTLSSPSNDPTAANSNAFLPTGGVTVTQSHLGTQSTFLHGDSGDGEDGVNGMHRMDNTSSTVSHNPIFSPSDGRSSAATSAPVLHGTATTTKRELGTQSTFLHKESGAGEDGIDGMH
jgi:hypothetical protein